MSGDRGAYLEGRTTEAIEAIGRTLARIEGRIDDHLKSDDRAHASQDERFLALTEKLVRIESSHTGALERLDSAHQAAMRSAIMVSSILGAAVGLVGGLIVHVLH